MMFTAAFVTLTCALHTGSSDPLSFEFKHETRVPGAETVSFDPVGGGIFRVAAGADVRTVSPVWEAYGATHQSSYFIKLGAPMRSRTVGGGIDFMTPRGAGLSDEVLNTPFFRGIQDAEWSATHISCDWPDKPWRRAGIALAIQVTVPGDPPIRRGAVIAEFPVAGTFSGDDIPGDIFRALAQEHGLPDCVMMLDDFRRGIGVNEYEPGSDGDSPGSVTLFSRIYEVGAPTRTVEIPRELAGNHGVRIHPTLTQTPEIDIEPEYITVDGNTAYITLQENNAIGVFDIEASAWTDIIPIPVITNTIDANESDGINIDDTVTCMPMPDQITAVDGALFFPGEGDVRNELGEGGIEDHARLGDLLEHPNEGRERLQVCTFTGDTDGDGVIDLPHAFGSRAVHRYDLETEEWTHTGSLIERTIAERFPEHWPEDRCDDHGPEPEGITYGVIDGRTVLFVGIKHPGAVMAFDTELNLLGVVMSAADGHTAPEGLCFVPAEASTLGVDTLAVAFEGSGHVVFYEVALTD